MKRLLLALALSATSLAGLSQTPSPEFHNTKLMKPPAGARVAVYEFEDLECPACAHAYPIVHAACDKYKVPLVRNDFTWSFHVWSLNAAVTARYLQDKISPQLADDFRRDVFAAQPLISNKDDLSAFTRQWFQHHGQKPPFVEDPAGALLKEVQADRVFGEKIGVHMTPTIFVVTQDNCIVVTNPDTVGQAIQAALSAPPPPPAATRHKENR